MPDMGQIAYEAYVREMEMQIRRRIFGENPACNGTGHPSPSAVPPSEEGTTR